MGCTGPIAAVVALAGTTISEIVLRRRSLWMAPLALPFVLIAGYWVFGRLLLLSALLRLRRRKVDGVLVFSDSPKWRPHIEREWLPVLRDRFVVLNWSERARWPRTVPVLIWKHFCAGYGAPGRNFNPAVLVLRGLRHPRVYRFYPWFQAAHVGEREGLEELERMLFSELGLAR